MLRAIAVYFYLLDSLPLLIGISTYVVYWPAKYLVGREMYNMVSTA